MSDGVRFAPATIQAYADNATKTVDGAERRVRMSSRPAAERAEACAVSVDAQFDRDTLLDQRDAAARDMDRNRGFFGNGSERDAAALRFVRADNGVRSIGLSLRRLDATLRARGEEPCTSLPPRTPRP
jgi:hypothetical protein